MRRPDGRGSIASRELGNGDVRTRRVFWCPVSVVQPTEKRTARTAPPLDRGQGHPQAASRLASSAR